MQEGEAGVHAGATCRCKRAGIEMSSTLCQPGLAGGMGKDVRQNHVPSPAHRRRACRAMSQTTVDVAAPRVEVRTAGLGRRQHRRLSGPSPSWPTKGAFLCSCGRL